MTTLRPVDNQTLQVRSVALLAAAIHLRDFENYGVNEVTRTAKVFERWLRRPLETEVPAPEE